MDPSEPRLKSLELQGYKTFASKHTFAFAPTITAVVGPNGSGKSNIADSIRWVLGEQSFSLLRGKRTEDMIFSGSETRSRASMAAATITFDNSDGWLPIDFSEVTISRRAYRDGQNEYLMNGQKVRLRDVNELLSKCGLSQRTYTIIGQGLVDAALSLRADERRRLFEEAAGIGLYRSKREESLRRLDSTIRNLERVQDILAELRPRLRSLDRQMKRSSDYEQVREDLHEVLRMWYGYHWYQLLDEITTVGHSVSEQTEARDALRRKQEDAEGVLGETRAQIEDLRSKLHTWNTQISELYNKREAVGKDLAVSEERLRWTREQAAILRAELELIEQDASERSTELENAREHLELEKKTLQILEQTKSSTSLKDDPDAASSESIQQELAKARAALEAAVAREAGWMAEKNLLTQQLEEAQGRSKSLQASLDQQSETRDAQVSDVENAASEMEMAQKRIAGLDAELAGVEHQRDEIVAELSNTRSQKAQLDGRLEGLEARFTVLSSADPLESIFTDALTGAVKSGEIKGLVGALLDSVKIPSKYSAAIIAALGEFQTGLAFQTDDDVQEAVEWAARKNVTGYGALLPGDPIRKVDPIRSPKDSACLGTAASLVKVDEELQGWIDVLLGRTLVVKTTEAAQRLINVLPTDGKVVTLSGEVYFPSGQVLVGARVPGREREEALRKTEKDLGDARGLQKELKDKVTLLEDELQASEQLLKELKAQSLSSHETYQLVRHRHDQAEVERVTAERSVESEQQQLVRTQEQVIQLTEQLEQLVKEGETDRVEREALDRRLEMAISQLESTQPDVQAARMEAKLEIARGAAAEAARRIDEVREQHGQLEARIEGLNSRLGNAQAEEQELEGTIEHLTKELTALESRLEELSDRAQPAEMELAAALQVRSEVEEKVYQLRSTAQEGDRTYASLQIDLARKREEQISLQRRIEDDFGLVAYEFDEETTGQQPLPFEGLVERLTKVEELPEDTEAQMNRLRLQLRRMGPINPEARREHREVKNRVEFLTRQVDDLREAESQVREVIAELDLLMEREFRKTFEAVAVEFRAAFSRLFGGGSARLTLTNPDDLTDTGIDIEARLPGRREQGLAMLSGGERSLTATALIFALLKVSPTPFCVLDEVDAMLDEANIGRFSEMLRELSEETQFILITHNRLTVQAAEVVYGVSMGLDSASKVIGLQLDEAAAAVGSD